MDKKELMKKAKELGVRFSYNESAEKINEKIQLKLAQVNEEVRSEETIDGEVKQLKVNKQGIVKVACKLPNGIRFETPYGEVLLKGVRMSEIVKAGGYLPTGTYNITPVDANAWDWILANYSDQPMIQNGVIFAEEKYESAKSKALELTDEVKSGFEQIDPKKLKTNAVVED